MFKNINIVLVDTSHPGNIGSVARAMGVMGFSNLRLVNPKYFPSDEANALAVGCKDILSSANVYNNFSEALGDNMLTIGFSARKRKVSIPFMSLDNLSEYILSNNSYSYNIVFGNERTGLTNENLLLCDYLVNIETHSKTSSLNLSAAVQLFTYNLFKKSFISNTDSITLKKDLATIKERDFYYKELISLLKKTGYVTEKNQKSLLKRIHVIFNKAMLEKDEINILHGILSSIRKKLIVD
tara:strand:- start:239 stop:958 length:720 start_codon:yes stop_codon:yes gene_type:complete